MLFLVIFILFLVVLFIRDPNNIQFSVLLDRTRAGASLNSGEIEIMAHRRVLSIDFDGPLNLDDSDYIHNMQSLLLFDTIQNSANLRKQLQYAQQFPPTLFFSQTSSSWNFPPSNSPLTKDFPPNVHLLTLSLPNSTSPALLRFVHIYELDDGSSFASPVQFNVNDYFKFATPSNQDEKYLSAMWSLKSHKRWNWKTTNKAPQNMFSQEEQPIHVNTNNNNGDFVVTLKPAQIRTFFANLNSK
jgi:alpha-mannosidase